MRGTLSDVLPVLVRSARIIVRSRWCHRVTDSPSKAPRTPRARYACAQWRRVHRAARCVHRAVRTPGSTAAVYRYWITYIDQFYLYKSVLCVKCLLVIHERNAEWYMLYSRHFSSSWFCVFNASFFRQAFGIVY